MVVLVGQGRVRDSILHRAGASRISPTSRLTDIMFVVGTRCETRRAGGRITVFAQAGGLISRHSHVWQGWKQWL